MSTTSTSTRITNPKQLVDEFKKSGEFDRLRRELLTQFKNHDSIDTFTSRVYDIVQQRLKEDAKLHYLPPEAAHSELMQDMDRFPLVQRTVSDLPALTDLAFLASIRRSLARLLNDGPAAIAIDGGKNSAQRTGEDGDGDVEMDDDSESESEFSDEEENENENEKDVEVEHDKQEGEHERKEEGKRETKRGDQAEHEHEAQPQSERDDKKEDDDMRDQDQVDSDTVIPDDMDMPQNSRIRRSSPPPPPFTEPGLEKKTSEADEHEIKAES